VRVACANFGLRRIERRQELGALSLVQGSQAEASRQQPRFERFAFARGQSFDGRLDFRRCTQGASEHWIARNANCRRMISVY
jgi:hypothetical protein